MNRRPLRAACLLCALCLSLTGCVAWQGAPAAQGTLPPVVTGWDAPENDVNQLYEQTVLLYLPSRDGTQLLAVPRTVTLSASRHTALALCDALLSHPATDSTLPVGGDVELSLAETRRLLGTAGFAISHSSKFDIILEYFIQHRLYDVMEINQVLFQYDMPLLGSSMG